MKRQLIALRVMLAQERKKAIWLGALLALLLIAVIRAGFALGPKTGVAAGSDKEAEVSSLASAGRDAVSRAIASDDALYKGRLIEVARPPRVSRNLFALDRAYFPTPPAKPEKPGQVPGADPSKTDADPLTVESETQNADDLARLLEAQVLEETTGWRLKSVLLGQQPTAVVETDGRSSVLRVGQSHRDWTVIEIAASAIVIEKQSVRVRLSIAKPER